MKCFVDTNEMSFEIELKINYLSESWVEEKKTIGEINPINYTAIEGINIYSLTS